MSKLRVDEKKKGGTESPKDGGKKKAKSAAGESGSRSELTPAPQYIDERLTLYTKLKAEHDALQAEKAAKNSRAIKVTLPDGKVVDADSWKTTPYQVACGISQGLADGTVIAKVNSIVWDLDRPLEEDCSLQLLKFDDEEAQAVYWHSSAHILGEAMERVYGGCLCYGPPIESGFYYDMFLENSEGVSSNDFPGLETLCKKIIKEKQPFERLEIKKETLLEMFKYNKFKCRILNEKVTTPTTTRYEVEWLEMLIGEILLVLWQSEYRKRGFQEVVTPNIYNSKLWQTSGHWQHYSENMFSFEVEKETFALKPMNCPGHCLMFDHRPRSWRELPIRMADFGVLHRNELSGALTGLTRVRRFQQDDAHIFCTMDQIEEEIKGCLDFLRAVYEVFGFTFKLNLSTRPEKFLGDPGIWEQAEKQLESSLNDFGEKWVLNPGDGAFYGPKIDIEIKDAIGRYHQCATIQLDFQLPIRFNLSFKRPVIIHRAILGSVERMIAILTENYGGKWPLWLSPRQVMVIPLGPTCEEYARKVQQEFHSSGFMTDVDLDPGCTLNKKIRNAQLAQYNFILVVGEKEKTSETVNVRTRDNKVHGERTVEECVERLKQLKSCRSRNAEEDF
uniref:threonine--tRNA ligase n=1 Tax=Cyclopterus lumpus TaxID=8103 RepID=A0A8C2ZWF4_CYCLU